MRTFLLRRALLSRAAFAMLFVSFAVAQADFITPTFRGGTDTTFQQWEVFVIPAGPNPPDVANANPNGTADLIETTGASFVTGGGNIYSFSAPTYFEATLPDFGYGAGYTNDVVVQIRTQGTSLDLTSILWNGIAPGSTTLLFTQPLGGMGGALEDYSFEWHGLAGNLATNLLTFNAIESSLSLDRVAIDTQTTAVPEASTLMLVGIALCGMTALRLRRRAS